YQLHPKKNGSYSFRVLHAFTGGDDGSTGSAGRMILRNGRLYGAATTGGAHGSGIVFELRRNGAGGLWTLQPLYSFLGAPDGSFPYGALLFDESGRISGTTYYGGVDGIGTAYQLTRNSDRSWSEKVLYSFRTGRDGNSSISNLVADSTGSLFGTTSEGGLGSGTIFQLTPNGNSWTESLPHLFAGPPDGGFPYAGMTSAGGDVFYGATVHGGTNGEGAIYQFTP
ncbi:MAG: choice-of-anchor tandem repeat GloVer-containing protein, partial [Chthoniobacterales bacterium]